MPAIKAWTTHPRMTWWKKAVTKRLSCSTESAGSTASCTPATAPMATMIRKPSTHIMGTSKRMAPRYRVKTQLRTMAPTGMAKISVERPRKVSVWVPAPRGRR